MDYYEKYMSYGIDDILNGKFEDINYDDEEDNYFDEFCENNQNEIFSNVESIFIKHIIL